MALQVQPTDVVAVAERAVERLRAQAGRRGLTITLSAPELPLTLIDPERIGQVLINLIHNAIKFTPPEGLIAVKIEAASPALTPRIAQELARLEGSGYVVISVSDTGIGIAAAELDRLFERFFKVDRARTRNSGGTGLGLAIAKHLVERHAGRIWAELQEGQGSTFRLLLPLA